METTSTPFDLNQAIQQWRDSLAQSPAIRGENLDELEVHLRDSVVRWQAHGLADDEAFLIATRRLGKNETLGAEFGKVNGQAVWIDRLFWAVIVFLGWTTVQQVYAEFMSILLTMLRMPSFGAYSSWQIVSQIHGAVVPTLIIATVIWHLFKRPESKFRDYFERLAKRPARLALALFFITASTYPLMSWLALHPEFYFGSRFQNILPTYIYFAHIPNIACFSIALYFMARKRLLKKA